MLETLQQALSRLDGGPLRAGAADLLAALGYRSERTSPVSSAAELLEDFGAEQRLTAKQRALFDSWRGADIVFQVTADEIADQAGQMTLMETKAFESGRNDAFLFLAVELAEDAYTRSRLADMTRAVNRLVHMPVLVFYRHGETLTLAVIHRRAHKRASSEDVLEKVTLIKDVRLADPHRAHLEILRELALPRMRDADVDNFDKLHAAWERTLDVEQLNRRFYGELFGWFERAVKECRFPDDRAGPGCNERHVIRLITRLLFIWFLKEKGLVPADLFEERFARSALKRYSPAESGYYRAVLQNLFFATLNTAIDKRRFSKADPEDHRNFSLYRRQEEIRGPDGFLDKLRAVPFVNGGLFECLDDFEGRSAGGERIDAFTDNPAQCRGLHVPASLFFDDDGLFPLFRRYKFTVEENTPLDREVALDPELLGRVFENLLAAYNPETQQTARKATGSYYTPRHIVDSMVDEALIACFLKNTPPYDNDKAWLEERLRLLLAFDQNEETARRRKKKGKRPKADDHLIDKTEIGPLIDCIDKLKVLDPACGSGAFPMGILQKLVLALGKLDPRNERWKARQREKAEAIDDPQAREKAVAAVESAFAPERGFGGFGRKLYLIRNAVHGVDIQPVACQIAKLRFFISLIVEQNGNDDQRDNYGVQPLPNLETRFVAADALIGPAKPKQYVFGGKEIEAIERELLAIRERYFSARDREAKRKCIAQDKQTRKKLADTLEKLHGFDHENARAIADWDPYAPNDCAPWFDPRMMFGVTEGFGIVIGNPPYVRGEKIPGKARLPAAFGDFYRGAADIYTYFFNRGVEFLRKDGLLCFIASNKFMRAGYGEPLRTFLKREAPPRMIVDFGELPVFEAGTDPAIFLAAKGGAHKELQAAAIKTKEEIADLQKAFGQRAFSMRVSDLRSDGWVLSPLLHLRGKIESAGKPLRKYVKKGVYRGIVTGLNEAFVIDEETRQRLIGEAPNSEELIQPWLRGKDVRRWRTDWANLYIIVIAGSANKSWPWSSADSEIAAAATFKKTYPAVYGHLFQFQDKLRKRQDKGRFFWELRECAYYSAFDKPKIIYPDIGMEMRAMLDRDGRMAGNTCYIVPGDDGYLLALLNSKLMDVYFRMAMSCLGDPFDRGRMRFFSADMERVPIAAAKPATKKRLAALANGIQRAKQANSVTDTADDERELNRLVYDLYNLNKTDIALIEKTVPS